ncbi:SLAP domain-containing protein [Lactobacillus sp. ESL0677]|uniref:SLAP domain-containing protein n=1 Tax=Lactobacillus sp. ESL0677 TaxID=2983208 RepID=UPI0023F7801F|nr:SLAP domain-containing protein [Lactobacillus sp. ESL0677]WEV36573.1 SLAP domain-containing protein [Lactobacillus sp. ESL0677]
MKKRVLISLASAALLSVGTVAVVNDGNIQPQMVQAAKKAKTFKIQLKKNAKVYTKRGKRKDKKVLKKGHYYTAYAKVTIHGRKYYRLSKGRYIKATTAKKAKIITVSNPTPVNTSSSFNTSSSVTASTTKNFYVTVNKPTSVYDSKGKSTGITLKKGLKEMTYGTKMINDKKYYLIDGNHYILVSDIDNGNTNSVIDSNNNFKNEIDNGNTNGVTNSNNTSFTNDFENGIGGDKPTQDQINYLLSNSNDKLGYAVYFNNTELGQIKSYLWQKIQDYREQAGYKAYKVNKELDNFVNNAVSSPNGLYDCQYAVDSEDTDNLAGYLPELNKHGMSRTRGFVEPTYYNANEVTVPISFNIKDRQPEHVAQQMFDGLVESTEGQKIIKGYKDNYSFASVGLRYNFKGERSSVGLIFIEVAGNSSEWINYYNEN